eukprot:6019203-Prymnesium_polylepis.1
MLIARRRLQGVNLHALVAPFFLGRGQTISTPDETEEFRALLRRKSFEHLPQQLHMCVVGVDADTKASVPLEVGHIDVGRAANHQLEFAMREQRKQPHR